jgi:hypothetical protein
MNTHQRASRALRGCASLSTRRHHQVTTVTYDASLRNTIHPRRAVESVALPCAHTGAQLAVQPVRLWTAPTQDAPVDSKCNTDLWGATPPLDLPNLTLLPSPIRQVSRRLEAPPVGQNAAKPALHTHNGTRGGLCAATRHAPLAACTLHTRIPKRSYCVSLWATCMLEIFSGSSHLVARRGERVGGVHVKRSPP